MISKKKAFTLTELLIVVIVIGVLSAVVLPKFNKVVETRKTTEAEEVMAAIRMEQEQRCSLNKQYTNDFTSFLQSGDVQLAAVPNDTAKAESHNFIYTLTGRRIKATSKDKGYTLQMPSIADGRISCDGSYCHQLNKDYPTRTQLESRSDFMLASVECAPTDSCDDDGEGATNQSCECTGTRSRSCNTATGTWEWGEDCVGGSAPQTDVVRFTPAGMGGANCAERKIKQVCRNNNWDWADPETVSEDTSGCHTLCTPGSKKYIEGSSCGCQGLGQQYVTCGSNGEWGTTEYCTHGACACTENVETSEGCNANGTRIRYCNTSTGEWTGTYSACTYNTCPGGTKDPTSCTNELYTKSIQRWKCDSSTGEWVKDGGCERAPDGCVWSALKPGYKTYCWACADQMTELPNFDEVDLGLTKSFYQKDGKSFSFYYAYDCTETCQTSETRPDWPGCKNVVNMGLKAKCNQYGGWEYPGACSDIFPKDENTMNINNVWCDCVFGTYTSGS